MQKLRKLIPLLLMVIVVAAGCVLGYRQITPISTPADFTEKTVILNQAKDGPDLDLMLTHLRAMASEVHSVCSDGIENTRNYLMDQLTQMGYAYEVEEYPLTIEDVLALNTERADYRGKPVRDTLESTREYAGLAPDATHMPLKNVVVTLDCPTTDDTVIFVAHTDSVKFGPGTMDDTISVVALMEALRLQKDQPLSRDLVFLFSDGEEQGMLGAAMYVKSHPEMKERTQMVINLEARGNTGAPLMFETTENNYGLVKHFAKGTQTPVGFSIATQVYHMMSNDTDLSWFMMLGYPGINFSVIEGAEVYHTADDNFEGFNRDSAAHYLETATDLVRYMATADLSDVSSNQDAVFFPLTKGNQIVLSTTVAKALGYLSLVLAVLAIVLLLVKKQASVGGLFAEVGMQLATLLVSAAFSFGVIRWVANANQLEKASDYLRYPPAMGIFCTLLLLAVLISLLAHLWLVKHQSKPLSLLAGLLPLLMTLTLATLLLFPAASYLFFLPLLMLSLTALIVMWGSKIRLLFGPLCYTICVFITLLLFVPIVYLVYVALSLSTAYAAVGLAMIPASVAFGLMSLMHAKA